MATPSMASPAKDELEKQGREYLTACASLPEPVQRCLGAWGMIHASECDPLDAHNMLRKAIDAAKQKRPPP
jgi:hypothetical protein